MARQLAFPDFPGVSTYKDRQGETRYRFRHPSIKEVTFKAAFGSPDFVREYDRLIAEVNAASAAKPKAEPVAKMAHIGQKTFRHAWVKLQGSVQWSALKEGTQDNNRSQIEEFLQSPILADAPDVLWADAPMAGVKADHLQDHYDDLYKLSPSKAKHRLEAVRKLYDQAVKASWINREDNKTKFIDTMPLPETDANRPWEEEDKAKFEAFWELGTPARTAYEIAIAVGARMGDVKRLGPSHIKNRVEYAADGSVLRRFRAIQWQAEKGRKGKNPTIVYHELSDRLEKALAALTHNMDPDLPFLRKSNGKPYTGNLSNRMSVWTDQAGMAKGFTMHGLRHTLGGELAARGLDIKQIQLALGHKRTSTTEHYVRRVNQERVMKRVAEVQNGSTEITIMKTVGNLKLVK